MDNEFGKFIRKLRGKESLRDVAERCNISHTHIADLEKGVNRSTKAPIKPSIDTIRELSKAYNFSYIELMYVAGYVDEAEDLALEENIKTKLIAGTEVDKLFLAEYLSYDERKKEKLRKLMEVVREE